MISLWNWARAELSWVTQEAQSRRRPSHRRARQRSLSLKHQTLLSWAVSQSRFLTRVDAARKTTSPRQHQASWSLKIKQSMLIQMKRWFRTTDQSGQEPLQADRQKGATKVSQTRTRALHTGKRDSLKTASLQSSVETWTCLLTTLAQQDKVLTTRPCVRSTATRWKCPSISNQSLHQELSATKSHIKL